MIRKLSIVLAITGSLAGCASANKRLGQGQELQAAGRPAEAAERYIQALKKNSKLDSARVNLRIVGAQAIENYLQIAASPTTQPDQAAEQFVAIDDLSRRTLEVGIFLPPPGDYDARKRAAFDRAIADDISDAPLLVNARQFGNALNRLARASSVYQPNAMQQAAIGTAGAEVALAWGRDDTTSGQFRSAYMRVDPIATSQNLGATLTSQARSLQAAALQRGTRKVAVVPPWATVNARSQLPDDALLALGDALVEAPWNTPPAFIAMLSPDQVARDLRYLGLGRRTITSTDAMRLARTTGADIVVVTEIDSVRREDLNMRTTRRPVRTRGGLDTAYYVDEGTARLFARATYVLIDRDGQRGSDYLSVSSSATAPFTRVRYAGDVRSLDLRQYDRELFDRTANDRDLVRALVNALSPRMAEAVFTDVSRRIP